MKGSYNGFNWVVKKRKDSRHTYPLYDFLVSHPEHPDFRFFDTWELRKKDYVSGHSIYSRTRQKDMAEFVISNFVNL